MGLDRFIVSTSADWATRCWRARSESESVDDDDDSSVDEEAMLEFRLPFQLAQCVVDAVGLLQSATPDAVIVSATAAAAYRRIKAEAIDDVALMIVC